MEQGNVVSVSVPKPKYPSPAQFGQYPAMEMVVDLVVNVGGQTTNLQGLPAGAEIADFGQNGNIVVSCSRDAMNGELVTYRQKSVDALNEESYHKGVIAFCDKTMNALNPELAASRQREQEINALRTQMEAMSKENAELKKQMTDFMSYMRQQLGTSVNTETKQSKTKQL